MRKSVFVPYCIWRLPLQLPVILSPATGSIISSISASGVMSRRKFMRNSAPSSSFLKIRGLMESTGLVSAISRNSFLFTKVMKSYSAAEELFMKSSLTDVLGSLRILISKLINCPFPFMEAVPVPKTVPNISGFCFWGASNTNILFVWTPTSKLTSLKCL